MAEIKNGFLISARQKVAGTVMYKAKGAQLMRGVPVYPKDYIGSDAQISARDTFGDMSSWLAQYAAILEPWNRCNRLVGRRYRGTYRDGVLGGMVGNFYTSPDGVPYNDSQRSTNLSFINARHKWWVLRNMRPPKFRQHVPQRMTVYSEGSINNGAMVGFSVRGAMVKSLIENLRRRGYPRLSTSKVGIMLWSSASYLAEGGDSEYALSTQVGNIPTGDFEVSTGVSKGMLEGNFGSNAGIVIYGVTDVQASQSYGEIVLPLFSLYAENLKLFY